jgi:hypothetical protein
MDTEFECSNCGSRFNQAAFAVVIYSPDAGAQNSVLSAKIFIFCSKECYRIPFHKALAGLTAEQRLILKNITIWRWDGLDKTAFPVPDAEFLFNILEESKSAYEEQIAGEGDDLEMLGFKEEKNNPESDDIARRLKRILLSARPEPSYPQNFKALYFLLRGPISEWPEKLE